MILKKSRDTGINKMEEYAFWSRACIFVYTYFGSLCTCTLCIYVHQRRIALKVPLWFKKLRLFYSQLKLQASELRSYVMHYWLIIPQRNIFLAQDSRWVLCKFLWFLFPWSVFRMISLHAPDHKLIIRQLMYPFGF